eukprot:Nitzschia sp. Nitz4//scaffold59_size112058//59056//60072//NITZ4_004110-RA/size112058-processed-gene-0.214-mRNA-1//-1//CDS//3329555126//3272//frame0
MATTILTLGLSWLLAPAWSSAMAPSLAWERKEFGEQRKHATLSLVIPAYNEQDRISIMLHAAYKYLQSKQGQQLLQQLQDLEQQMNLQSKQKDSTITTEPSSSEQPTVEWIVVNDGSKDDTVGVVTSVLSTFADDQASLVSLHENSGKGAAVQTGMLLAQGSFSLMVDADGATDFGPGLEALVHAMQQHVGANPASTSLAALGSRAHLQQAKEDTPTAERTLLRTILMHGFGLLVRLLVSAEIQDTQCGFKLFTRPATHMAFGNLHLHRWAFDTEIVLLAEWANIPLMEVSVPWKEVDGSKLSTTKLQLAMVSLQMLRDMLCVRLCYLLGIWKLKPKI